MKILLFVFITFGILVGYSQSIEVLKKSNLEIVPELHKFDFILASNDSNKFQFVATLLVKEKAVSSSIEKLYLSSRIQANLLGTNCFSFKSFSHLDSSGETSLIINCYRATDSSLIEAKEVFEKNVVYVFGKEKEGDKSIFFNINNEKREISSGSYFRIGLNQGETVMINKGGPIGGATVWLNWEKDKQPYFYTLSGFGMNNWEQQVTANIGFGTVNSIAFTTGKINRILDNSLGFLLIYVLKQGN